MALSEDTLDIIQKYFPEDIGTVKKLSSIPGFDDELNAGLNLIRRQSDAESFGPAVNDLLKQNIEAASTNPTEYVLKAMRSGVRSAVNQADPALLTKQIDYLKQNNVPLDTIQARYTEHAAKQAAFDARNVELKAQQGGGFFGGISNELAQLDKNLGLSQNAVPIAALAALAASGGLAGVGIPGLGAAGAGAAGTAAAADLAAAYGATGAGVGAGTAAGIGAGAAAADLAAAYGGSGAGVGAGTAAGTNALATGAGTAAGAAQAQAAIDAAGVAGAAGTGAGAAGATAAGAAQAQAGIDAATAAGARAALPAAAAGAMPSWMTPAAMVGSSLIGANAAQTAAKTQSDAAAQANQLLAQQYATQRADLAPFTAAGVGAQNKLLTYLGLPGGTQGADFGKYTKDFTGADLLAGQDPGYGFRLSEGQKALERSAAARGGLLSGGTGKALTSYGQQMGSQEYQNAYNRYQTNRTNQLAPLFTLTGSGQASAAGQAAAAGNYATGAANNLTSAGAARAAGDVGTANALTSGLGSYLNYSGQQDLLAAYNERTRQSAYRS